VNENSITAAEIASRARRLKLILTDCDGVLTDGGVYYSERGEELKRFNIRDGMAVERLRQLRILTQASSPANSQARSSNAPKNSR